jgi:SAM-dependent methyltransferase
MKMNKLLQRLTPLRQRLLRWPVIRHLRAMQFRRLRPLQNGRLSQDKTQVIRYYWAKFLEKQRADIRGRGLEIGETATLCYYGGTAITQAEAMDVSAHSPEVTVVADLSRADHVASDQYDCFINQFTTAVIYDIEAALYHAIRILKPGGVLLINFWCVDFYLHRGLDMGTGEPLYMYWMFTPIQVANLLHRLGVTEADYRMEIYGNLLTRMAFLLNLPAEELTPAELNFYDPGQPLLICVRLVKPAGWQGAKPAYREPLWTPSGAPARMSPNTGHYGDEYNTLV